MNIWSWFLHGDSSHPTRHGWGEGRAFEAGISDSPHEHCHLSPLQSHSFLRPSDHWLCHFCPPNYHQPLLFLPSLSHFLFRHHDKILLFTHFPNPYTFTCTHSHNYFQTCVISTLLDTSVSLPFSHHTFICLLQQPGRTHVSSLFPAFFQSKSDILNEQLQCFPIVCKVMFKFLISIFSSWDSFIPRG